MNAHLRGILGCEVSSALLWTPQSQRDADTMCAPTEALDLLQKQVRRASTVEGLTWPKQHPSPSALPGAMLRPFLTWQRKTAL